MRGCIFTWHYDSKSITGDAAGNDGQVMPFFRNVPFGFKLVDGAAHILLEAEVVFAAGLVAFLFFVVKELAAGVDMLLAFEEF